MMPVSLSVLASAGAGLPDASDPIERVGWGLERPPIAPGRVGISPLGQVSDLH